MATFSLINFVHFLPHNFAIPYTGAEHIPYGARARSTWFMEWQQTCSVRGLHLEIHCTLCSEILNECRCLGHTIYGSKEDGRQEEQAEPSPQLRAKQNRTRPGPADARRLLTGMTLNTWRNKTQLLSGGSSFKPKI